MNAFSLYVYSILRIPFWKYFQQCEDNLLRSLQASTRLQCTVQCVTYFPLTYKYIATLEGGLTILCVYHFNFDHACLVICERYFRANKQNVLLHSFYNSY